MSAFDDICGLLYYGPLPDNAKRNFAYLQQVFAREKVDLNQINEQFLETPLRLVLNGKGYFLDSMELLIQQGADPNFPTIDGWLPLEEGIEAALREASINAMDMREIQLLLKHGADINKVGGSGKTVYEFAKSRKSRVMSAFFDDYKKNH